MALSPTLTFAVDDELLGAAGPQLKVVANFGVGYDNVDLAACAARGVTVTNTPGALTNATAELALALAMAAARDPPAAGEGPAEGGPAGVGPEAMARLRTQRGEHRSGRCRPDRWPLHGTLLPVGGGERLYTSRQPKPDLKTGWEPKELNSTSCSPARTRSAFTCRAAGNPATRSTNAR